MSAPQPTSDQPGGRQIHRVSFIIPAWNEEAVLGRTLRALTSAAQNLPMPWEIVVADDASDDRTAEIAREHGARVVTAHYRQIAATRNNGARAALGDLLVFIDADTWVNPQAVRAAIAAVEGGAVGGGCRVRFDGPFPFYARWFVPIGSWLYFRSRLAAGCFIFCTRQAFEAVGGFDETVFASEECWFTWAMRRHGRFDILPESVTTSARKLRTFSGREFLSILVAICLRGVRQHRPHSARKLWYGPRRPDPHTG